MDFSFIQSRPCFDVDVRREQGQHYPNEPDDAAEGAGNGRARPTAESQAKAVRPDRVDYSPVGPRTHVTANDLQTHLVCAIAARTNGRVQELRVQIQGGRTVLSGFAESYYAIQLAMAGLMDTLDTLGLDRPGRVELNIDVIPSHSAKPGAADT